MTLAATADAPAFGASQAAIVHHYDVGNDFYEIWLDADLVYSCAKYASADPETLEAAQRRKLRHHLEQARVGPGSRVLDIGCGWGATLAGAAYRGAGEAVGLTLSPSQAAYVQARYREREGLGAVKVCVESWSQHAPARAYDAIISIGAFEHFARPGLTSAARISAYREFFEYCHDVSSPGARLSLQTIFLHRLARRDASTFLMQEIYPETDVPALQEVLAAAEGIFDLEALHTDGLSYMRTLNEWRRRLIRNRSKAVALVGAPVVERYEKYLGVCAVAFRLRNLDLARFTFRRD